MIQTNCRSVGLPPTLIILIFLSLAQPAGADVTQAKLDSLWIRASSGEIRFAEQVQPSKDSLAGYGSDAVEFLVDKMNTRSALEMQILTDILGKIGVAGIPRVCQQLDSPDDFRARLACRVLGRIKDPAAVPCLLPHAFDPLFNIRAGVATALGEIGHPSATDTLRKMAKDQDYLARKSAVVALGKMPFEKVADDLVNGLSDGYYGVRYAAASSLVGFGKPAAAILKKFISNTLIVSGSLLPQPRIYALALAADCLGKIGDKSCSKTLQEMIQSDYDPVVMGYAARALGVLEGKSSLKFLKKIQLSQNDIFVQSMIAEGILSASAQR